MQTQSTDKMLPWDITNVVRYHLGFSCVEWQRATILKIGVEGWALKSRKPPVLINAIPSSYALDDVI